MHLGTALARKMSRASPPIERIPLDFDHSRRASGSLSMPQRGTRRILSESAKGGNFASSIVAPWPWYASKMSKSGRGAFSAA